MTCKNFGFATIFSILLGVIAVSQVDRTTTRISSVQSDWAAVEFQGIRVKMPADFAEENRSLYLPNLASIRWKSANHVVAVSISKDLSQNHTVEEKLKRERSLLEDANADSIRRGKEAAFSDIEVVRVDGNRGLLSRARSDRGANGEERSLYSWVGFRRFGGIDQRVQIVLQNASKDPALLKAILLNIEIQKDQRGSI